MKKNEKDSDNFWEKIDFESQKLALLITWFRADVDRTKKLRKSAIFHLIKLPFDVEVDEKFLNVI